MVSQSKVEKTVLHKNTYKRYYIYIPLKVLTEFKPKYISSWSFYLPSDQTEPLEFILLFAWTKKLI